MKVRRRWVILILFLFISTCYAGEVQEWKITAYCPCSICCGKWADGYMASGKKAQVGYVACNILPFGTKVYIDGLGEYEVQDRGSKKHFDNQKHIDIYFDSHKEAKGFGVKYISVEVVE